MFINGKQDSSQSGGNWKPPKPIFESMERGAIPELKSASVDDFARRQNFFGYKELYQSQDLRRAPGNYLGGVARNGARGLPYEGRMRNFKKNLRGMGAPIAQSEKTNWRGMGSSMQVLQDKMEILDEGSLLYKQYRRQLGKGMDESTKENRINDYQLNFSRQFSNVAKNRDFYFGQKIDRERSRNTRKHRFDLGDDRLDDCSSVREVEREEYYNWSEDGMDGRVFSDKKMKGIELRRKKKKPKKKNLRLFGMKNRLDSRFPLERENQKLRKIKTNLLGDSDSSDHDAYPQSSGNRNVVKTYLRGFAANTDQGIVRDYNEDRVSIILNIMKPDDHPDPKPWPNCCFFGVYDGHGGSDCADFLRDNLHKYVINDPSFPFDCRSAIKRGFAKAEREFCANAVKGKTVERSGSCAVVVILVKNEIYVANVGDSRAVASYSYGNRVKALSNDHKPSEIEEQQRILKAGGRLYRSEFQSINSLTGSKENKFGPLRVLPGRLSVSRTFGDIEAKLERLGGKKGVVVADPEIEFLKLTPDLDFIVLGSDGIFDRLNNEELVSSSWEGIKKAIKDENEEEITNQDCCSAAIDSIMSRSLLKKTQDNISTVIISFRDFLSVNIERENGDLLMKKLNQVLTGIGGGGNRSRRSGNKRVSRLGFG